MGGKTKTLLMVDATGSMYALLTQVKEKMKIMLERIGQILKEHGYEPEQSLMKISFYRNYSNDKDEIYGSSEWRYKGTDLISYLNTFSVAGGQGNEAVEIGLCKAIDDIKDEEGLSQIILIGDAGCNTPDDMKRK